MHCKTSHLGFFSPRMPIVLITRCTRHLILSFENDDADDDDDDADNGDDDEVDAIISS